MKTVQILSRLKLAMLCAMPGVVHAQQSLELMDVHRYGHLIVDEFEMSDLTNERNFEWDADFSYGGDLHRLLVSARGHQSDEETDENELQLLYSKAILPFWNLRAGIRHDFEPLAERNWAAVSVAGLAPYFFEVEAELFLAEGGQVSVRAQAEYELLLTQRLSLIPELRVTAFATDEPARLIGSGLSALQFEVRLRYQFRRELAPYLRLGMRRRLGKTGDLALAAGYAERETELSIGLHAWF